MNHNRMQTMHHFRQHRTIYLFMIILFLTGIIFGAIIVNSMSFVQKHDLFFYVEQFFKEITENPMFANWELVQQSFLYHAKYLFLLFILGLSVIGMPVVWVLLFIKGLVVGFTVGFMVNQLGFQGLVLAALSIAPQNILIIPIYIIAGSLSMIFSITLLNRVFSSRNVSSIFQPFLQYMMIFIFLAGLSFAAAGIEGYISNEAMAAYTRSIF